MYYQEYIYKTKEKRKLMASSSSGKICIQCGERFKENNPLNHVGTQYRDDQNEKHPRKTVLEQTYALKLNNVASKKSSKTKLQHSFIYHLETT